MGLADVEANYAVVKAYQFTTLTSIQVRENAPDSAVPLDHDITRNVKKLSEEQNLTLYYHIINY